MAERLGSHQYTNEFLGSGFSIYMIWSPGQANKPVTYTVVVMGARRLPNESSAEEIPRRRITKLHPSELALESQRLYEFHPV